MVKVRFAPSPSGSLHIGSARTAIVNYLFAQSLNGKMVLRVEDTDDARTTQESKDAILSTLRWLKIQWDEGPFYQSERLPIYHSYIKKLLETGSAYRCFCSKEELNERKEKQISEGLYPSYDGKCAKLSILEIEEKLNKKIPFMVRLKSQEQKIEFNDLLKNRVEFRGDLLTDIVLTRTDGSPTYNFAVVIDDYLMEITHVIRGEDHLSNTPKQIAIYKALGWDIPEFCHLPLILGPDKTKLSKRHCDTAIEDYQRKGYLPEAIFCYLSLVGYSHHPTREIFDQKTLVSSFKLDQLSNSPSQFDLVNLNWMNGQFIKAYDPMELLEVSRKWLEPIPLESEKKEKIFLLSKNQIKTLDDIPSLFEPFINYRIDLDNPQIQNTIQSVDFWLQVDEFFLNLNLLNIFDEGSLEKLFTEIVDKYLLNKKNFAQIIRIIITGRLLSPPLFDTLLLLGREDVVLRYSQFLREIKNDKKN